MIFFYFYIISLSLVGYGLFISRILKIQNNCLGLNGVLGITFFALISYFSSLFLSHGLLFNSLVVLIGLLIFLINFYKKKFQYKKLIIFFLTFTILLIFITVAKNHDDFPYYHFPYTNLLVEYSHPVGIGKWNNGFRSPSSIFFISSIFYLPGVGIYLYHITSALILGFCNIIFINIIFNKKEKSRSLIKYFCILVFIFVNIFFYRLAEHGTDRSGMVLTFLSVVYLLKILNSNSDFTDYKKKIIAIFSILIFFIITIKPSFLINLLFFLVLIYYKDLRKIFFQLFWTRYFYYCLSFLLLTIFFTFINSGCLVFPIHFLCFENLSWSVNEEVKDVKIWFELWAKAGASPNYIVENKIDYITGFNWVQNWINNYFFNKVSDFLLGISFLCLIVTLFFYSKERVESNNKYFFLYLLLIIFILEWFFYHPALRYGGYHLFALLVFIPLSSFLSKIKISEKKFYSRSLILILITLVIFLYRNSLRLEKEYNQYNYVFFKNVKYKFIGGDEDFYFRYSNKMRNELNNFNKINILGKNFIIVSAKQK